MSVRTTIICALFLSLISVRPGFSREALDHPNVIIIFLDDAGYGDFAHNGNPTIRTPQISTLAREGINFTQFYTSSSACTASRYSLLTGRVPKRSGLGGWAIPPSNPTYIHPKEVTLAEGFKSRGYATAMFGKWHLGSPNESNGMAAESLPLANGFDQWIGTNVSHDYDDAKLMKSVPDGTDPVPGYTTLASNLPLNPKVTETLTGLYTDGAVKFIRENKDRPFFAYIAHNEPHLPVFASDKFKGRSRRGLFGDVMMEIDDSVGRVLAAVRESGIEKNTLIFFASDNGPWWKFKFVASHPKYGEARMNVGNADAFRDGKGSTWEGGYRVPCIFWWPGVIKENTVVQDPVSALDILPTVFHLIGAEVPTDRTIDGRDIRHYLAPDLFKGEVKPINFLYSYVGNKASGIRRGPWKLCVAIYSQTGNDYGFTASPEKPLLFQVEQDIGERIDRAAEHPDIVKDMLKDFNEYEEQIKKEGTFWDEK